MARFKAQNTTRSAWNSFYHRVNYKKNALPKNPEIKDFSFAEDTLYGRVDPALNTVYPDENKMTTLINSEATENSFRLLDFVADAFIGVKNAMDAAAENGTIPTDQAIFSKFSIKKAYQSPSDLYNAYIDNLMDRYITEYLYGQNLKKKVLNFSQFVNHLIHFLKNQTDHTPVTFTSWQRSTTSNIFTSGIAVDIGTFEYGDDPRTERVVLDNPCLPYYLKVCRANGFLVSNLNPTIMVADILSPGLLPYATARQIYSTEEVFTSRYLYAYTIDYETLVTKFIDGFNLFVSRSPLEKIVSIKCRKSHSYKLKERSALNPNKINNVMSMSSLLVKYTQIRNMEEEYILDKKTMDSLIRRIKITKSVDKDIMMRYINRTFRETYKLKYGGLNYFSQKLKARNEIKEPSTQSASGASLVDSGVSDTTSVAQTSVPSGGGSSGGSSGGY